MASLQKNLSGQNFTFCMVSATTGAADASATVSVKVTKDNGAQASGGGTVTNVGNGQYNYAPTQAETNATDVGFLLTATGDIPVNIDFHTDQVDGNGLLKVDVEDIGGTALSTHASGMMPSDVRDIAGSAVSASSAQLGVNVVQVNAVATSSVTTINANQGTTQPVNFTGTAGSALVKSDVTDIAGSAVSTSSAQLGVNVVNITGQAAVLDANNLLKVDVEDINGNATAAQNVSKANQAIGRGTCTTGGTTTSVPTSAWSPGGVSIVSGQFIGRTIIFDANTTTGALQGQATNITANTASATPTFTVTALTTAPSSGDTFSVV